MPTQRSKQRLKFWGWGLEGEGPDAEATKKIAAALGRHFGLDDVPVASPPTVEELDLRAPPTWLSGIRRDATRLK